MVSDECKYTRTHEWIKQEGDLAVVGVTHYAQEALGDITFVELPAPGTHVSRGQECAVVESVKAASDIYSPISGDVSEVNHSLEEAPEKINRDPYGEGWIFKLEGYEPGDFDHLMDGAAYERFLESER